MIGDGCVSRILRFPGDLDTWHVGTAYNKTFPGSRTNRHGLLPLLDAKSGDWGDIAHPPLFPQQQYWSSSLAFSTPKATINVLELDLGEPRKIKSLTLSTLGRDPALALLAVTGEKAGKQDLK